MCAGSCANCKTVKQAKASGVIVVNYAPQKQHQQTPNGRLTTTLVILFNIKDLFRVLQTHGPSLESIEFKPGIPS